jgi:hypothetical protein
MVEPSFFILAARLFLVASEYQAEQQRVGGAVEADESVVSRS